MPELPPLFQPPDKLDFLDNIRRAQDSLGDCFRLPFGNSEALVVCHPELAYEVLIRQVACFAKLGATGQAAGLPRILGSGILTNPNRTTWLEHRRILQPAFHQKTIDASSNIILEVGQQLLSGWSDGEYVNLSEALLKAGQQIMYRLVFSQAAPTGGSLDVPLSLATARVTRVKKLRRQLEHHLATIIHARQTAQDQYTDILQLLIHARDSQNKALPEKQIIDELLTIFAAGQETTAHAVCWTVYLLSCHPAVLKQLQAELDSSLEKRSPRVTDLSKLPFLQSCFKESLRLYPVIPSAPRVCLHDTELAGFFIPQHMKTFVSIYAIHRHPTLWSEPDTFLPERFLESTSHQAYMPFGLGERFCIGRNLANLQGQLLLALLFQQFSFELEEARIRPKLAISLAVQDGLKVKLYKR